MSKPAISRLALPELRYAYRIASMRLRRSRKEHGVKIGSAADRLWADDAENLRRQIQAAIKGSPTWTDVDGSIWGPDRLLVGGTIPAPGASHIPGRFLKNPHGRHRQPGPDHYVGSGAWAKSGKSRYRHESGIEVAKTPGGLWKIIGGSEDGDHYASMSAAASRVEYALKHPRGNPARSSVGLRHREWLKPPC